MIDASAKNETTTPPADPRVNPFMGGPSRWRNRLIAAACVLVFSVILHLGLEHEHRVDDLVTGDLNIRDGRLILWSYACMPEHSGQLPPLSFTKKGPYFDETGVAPGYQIDRRGETLDPNDTHAMLMDTLNGYAPYLLEPCVTPADYIYLGYAVTNEQEGMRYLAWCREQMKNPHLDGKDITVEPGVGTAGTDTLRALRINLADVLVDKGVDRAVATTAIAKTPLLIERPGHYSQNGAWVMFLDMHAEFLPYPGPFPMTQEFMDGLSQIHKVKQKSGGASKK